MARESKERGVQTRLTLGAVSRKALKHRGWVVSGSVVILALLASLLMYRAHWWIAPGASPVRVTVAGGCPTSLGGRDGVSNAGLGFWLEFLPRNPVGGLICTYQPINGEGLDFHKAINGIDATRLARAADAGNADRPLFADPLCPLQGSTIMVLAFAYRGRPDVDLWYDSSGCGTFTNGRLRELTHVEFDRALGQIIQR